MQMKTFRQFDFFEDSLHIVLAVMTAHFPSGFDLCEASSFFISAEFISRATGMCFSTHYLTN